MLHQRLQSCFLLNEWCIKPIFFYQITGLNLFLTPYVELLECCICFHCFTQSCCTRISNFVCCVPFDCYFFFDFQKNVYTIDCSHNRDWAQEVSCLQPAHCSNIQHQMAQHCYLDIHFKRQPKNPFWFQNDVLFEMSSLSILRAVIVVLLISSSLSAMTPLSLIWLTVWTTWMT